MKCPENVVEPNTEYSAPRDHPNVKKNYGWPCSNMSNAMLSVTEHLLLRFPSFGCAPSGLHCVRKEKLCASLRRPLFKMIKQKCKSASVTDSPIQIPELQRRSREGVRLKKKTRKEVPVQRNLGTSSEKDSKSANSLPRQIRCTAAPSQSPTRKPSSSHAPPA